MLCRIILTAIAISCTFSREIIVHARGQGSQRSVVQIKDVICVLLLSGLQKDDLDANTLAKLRRHHVNIDDMNNESLRQECLKKSSLDPGKGTKAYEITEEPNDKTRISTKKQTYSDDLNVDKQKSEIVTPDIYSVDKTNVRNLIDEKNLKEGVQREQDRNDKGRISNVMELRPDDINNTMLHKGNEDQQVQNFKDHPSLDSVMKFWAKLTNAGDTKALTEVTTTYSPSPTEEKIVTTSSITPNLGNAHSKEMEYISKMIAEYIGSQTVPTTTQVSQRTKNTDIVSRTIEELLNRSSKPNSIPIPKNMENTFGGSLKELRDITELGKLFQTYKHEEDETQKALLKSQKVIKDENIIDETKRSEMMPYSPIIDFTPRAQDMESAKKMQALQYLNNMLRGSSKIRLNGPISIIDVGSQEFTTNNEDQEVHEKKQHDIKNKRNNKVSVTVQNTNSNKEKVENVSADVIKEIAEKIKEIVMRDIRKEIPTTERATTTTVRSTTANPTIKVPSESNVIQTLMELFKEYKTMKDATKGTTDKPIENTSNVEKLTYSNILSDRMYPPVMGSFNPYVEKTPVLDVKRFEINAYKENVMPIPYGKILNPPLHGPTFIPQTNFNQKIEYQMPPITIQTNSAEIAPLVIQVSKPMKAMNQHIIVTTQNPFETQRHKKLHEDNKQRLNLYNYAEPLHVADERDHHVEDPTYVDLTKKLRIAENVKQEFRDSYKDKIQKIMERKQHNRDKFSELNGPLDSNHGIGLSEPIQSNHHVSPSLGLNHHSGQIGDSNRHHHQNRLLDSNRHKTFDRPLNINHREMLNEPAEINHHDIITREFISRLEDSNHHDDDHQMVDSNPHIRRPIEIDRQSRGHQSDAYERFEHEQSHPRYKKAKFHEKLEQLENRPQNNYEVHNIHNKETTESYCDTVAAREQMPLMKIKQHPRFDDSHFKKFLKSQQKVTDMLERILAEKTKAKTQSGEKR